MVNSASTTVLSFCCFQDSRFFKLDVGFFKLFIGPSASIKKGVGVDCLVIADSCYVYSELRKALVGL